MAAAFRLGRRGEPGIVTRIAALVFWLLALAAACADTVPTEHVVPPPAPPFPSGPAVPTLIDGRILVLGHDRQVGWYGPGSAVVEAVATGREQVAILKTWSAPGPDASLTAIAVDGSKGWSEIHAGRIGNAPHLPLLFFVGGTPSGVGGGEKMRIMTDGGLRLSPAGERPACNEERRGVLWFQRAETGDVLHVCLRRGAGDYHWVAAAS